MKSPTTNRNKLLTAFAGSAAVSGAIAAGLVLSSYFTTQATLVNGALLGVAAAWFGSLSGSLPTVWALGKAPQLLMSGALAGLCVRFVATLAPALVLATIYPTIKTPLLLWAAIAQLIFLAADTLWMIRNIKRMPIANGSAR